MPHRKKHPPMIGKKLEELETLWRNLANDMPPLSIGTAVDDLRTIAYGRKNYEKFIKYIELAKPFQSDPVIKRHLDTIYLWCAAAHSHTLEIIPAFRFMINAYNHAPRNTNSPVWQNGIRNLYEIWLEIDSAPSNSPYYHDPKVKQKMARDLTELGIIGDTDIQDPAILAIRKLQQEVRLTTRAPGKGEADSTKPAVAGDFQKSAASSKNLSVGVRSFERHSAAGFSPQKAGSGMTETHTETNDTDTLVFTPDATKRPSRLDLVSAFKMTITQYKNGSINWQRNARRLYEIWLEIDNASSNSPYYHDPKVKQKMARDLTELGIIGDTATQDPAILAIRRLQPHLPIETRYPEDVSPLSFCPYHSPAEEYLTTGWDRAAPEPLAITPLSQTAQQRDRGTFGDPSVPSFIIPCLIIGGAIAALLAIIRCYKTLRGSDIPPAITTSTSDADDKKTSKKRNRKKRTRRDGDSTLSESPSPIIHETDRAEEQTNQEKDRLKSKITNLIKAAKEKYENARRQHIRLQQELSTNPYAERCLPILGKIIQIENQVIQSCSTYSCQIDTLDGLQTELEKIQQRLQTQEELLQQKLAEMHAAQDAAQQAAAQAEVLAHQQEKQLSSLRQDATITFAKIEEKLSQYKDVIRQAECTIQKAQDKACPELIMSIRDAISLLQEELEHVNNLPAIELYTDTLFIIMPNELSGDILELPAALGQLNDHEFGACEQIAGQLTIALAELQRHNELLTRAQPCQSLGDPSEILHPPRSISPSRFFRPEPETAQQPSCPGFRDAQLTLRADISDALKRLRQQQKQGKELNNLYRYALCGAVLELFRTISAWNVPVAVATAIRNAIMHNHHQITFMDIYRFCRYLVSINLQDPESLQQLKTHSFYKKCCMEKSDSPDPELILAELDNLLRDFADISNHRQLMHFIGQDYTNALITNIMWIGECLQQLFLHHPNVYDELSIDKNFIRFCKETREMISHHEVSDPDKPIFYAEVIVNERSLFSWANQAQEIHQEFSQAIANYRSTHFQLK